MLLFLSVAAFAQSSTLNSAWQFVLDDDLTIETIDHVDKWTNINLPHTWNRLDPFDEEDGYRLGVGWYRKNLVFSKCGKDHVFIRFEGANEHATVFLNGKKVTRHAGGYTAFTADLTPYIQWDHDNELILRVDSRMNRNIPPLSMNYTFYGGIYRDVWLIRKGPQHFDQMQGGGPGVWIRTPAVSGDKAGLEMVAEVANKHTDRLRAELVLNVYDAQGQSVASEQQKVVLGGYAQTTAAMQVVVAHPSLWSPDDPYLYRVEVLIRDAKTGGVLDKYVSRRGFRWFEMDENRLLRLNGEPLKVIGSCRHQDHPDFGSALPDALHRRDMELLKAMGGNFLRTSHYPQDPAIFEACDELGILVWEELPIVNYIAVSDTFRQVSLDMLREMIVQHRNHTSAFAWGLANEVLLQYRRGARDHSQGDEEKYLGEVRDLIQELHDKAKILDPDRWTAIAHHGAYELHEEAGLNSITDIVGWNLYYGWYSEGIDNVVPFIDRVHGQHPDQGIILSEYGGGSDPRIHADEPRRFDFSIEWQTGIHASYLPIVRTHPNIMGGALWILADFNSEGLQDAVPHINSKGILNLDRSPKDSYLYYQAANAIAPYLRIGSLGWRTRAGFAGEDGMLRQPVYVFTNQSEVKVYLNGEDLGSHAVDNYHLRLMADLKPGTNRLEVRSGDGFADSALLEAEVIPVDLPAIDPSKVEIRMNLGAHFYFVDDLTGEVWIPERPYAPGSAGYIGGHRLMTWNGDRVGTNREIFGSPNEPLYQTHRDSIEAFRADVPDGWHEVTVHFAEVVGQKAREQLIYNLGADTDSTRAAGQRHFHLRMNGDVVRRDIRLQDYQATEIRIPVRVEDGEGITIEIVAVHGGAVISAVEISGY
jgi:beta-galactosidase